MLLELIRDLIIPDEEGQVVGASGDGARERVEEGVVRLVRELEGLAQEGADAELGEAGLGLLELVQLVGHGVDEVLFVGGGNAGVGRQGWEESAKQMSG